MALKYFEMSKDMQAAADDLAEAICKESKCNLKYRKGIIFTSTETERVTGLEIQEATTTWRKVPTGKLFVTINNREKQRINPVKAGWTPLRVEQVAYILDNRLAELLETHNRKLKISQALTDARKVCIKLGKKATWGRYMVGRFLLNPETIEDPEDNHTPAVEVKFTVKLEDIEEVLELNKQYAV